MKTVLATALAASSLVTAPRTKAPAPPAAGRARLSAPAAALSPLPASPSLVPALSPIAAPTSPLMNDELRAAPALNKLASLAAIGADGDDLSAAPAAEESLRSGFDGSERAPAPVAWRLPTTVKPRTYDVKLRLEPESASFSGRVKISVSASEPVRGIKLNALDLSFTRVTVAGRPVDLSRIAVDKLTETITLPLEEPLTGDAVVELEYAGAMNELMRGLFKATWKQGESKEAWAFTHLEPTHLRRLVPGFDEPAFKAKWKLSVDVPAELTPISNMPAVAERIENGRKLVEFAETPEMSSYLFAVYAARLEKVTRMVGDTAVTAWAHASQIAQTSFALDAAAHSLGYLNEYFAHRYGLPKLDLVVAPDFASGAMENWGAVLFRDTAFLIDPLVSSEAAKRRVAEVVAHEIVHQWFGNLVTMGWWNDLWLNEAFATWLATKVVDAWKPEWRVWDEYSQHKRDPLAIDALPGTRPVRSDANTPAEIQAMFDPMSYDKGGALLRMLESFLGETVFRDGIRGYIRRFAGGNAVAGDLAAELETASGQPVARLMDRWMSQGGVPLVDASLVGPDTVLFDQERFSAFGLRDRTKWPIPMTIRYRLVGDVEPRSTRLLIDDAADLGAGGVRLPGEIAWAYPNAGESGYYRMKLGRQLLKRVLAHRAELTPIERSGLLNDLWALTRAGELPVDEFLGALRSFRGDESRLVLEDTANYLLQLRKDLAASDAERAALSLLARELLGPAAESLGWTKGRDETQERTLTRPVVLNALALLDPGPALASQVDSRLEAYLRDPATVEPSVASVVLKAAARRNDPAVFEAFRERLINPVTPEQKGHMIRALSEFTDPALIDRYLGMTLTDDLRPQDAWTPFVVLMDNPAARERAWTFIKTNWAALAAKVGPRGATRIIGAIAPLASAERRAEAELFFRDPSREIEMARKTLAQTLEAMDLGVRFRETQGPALARWAAAEAR